jgi:GMP synthase-like glutamine amidotransferase
MKIGLLECDHVPERLRFAAGGYREMFAAWLGPHVADLGFEYYDACHGELPAATDACDVYVCTGSRYSAYDELTWLAALKDFVRELRPAGRPFVGICFGHQVLAEALGGRVARAPQGWGVGVHEISIVAAEPWMRPPRARCSLQHMHADEVQQLPEGSVLLARSEHCEVGMYRVGRMLGIEGHPEFPAAYNEALIRERRERIGPARADEALATLSQPTDGPVLGEWVGSFLRDGPVTRS